MGLLALLSVPAIAWIIFSLFAGTGVLTLVLTQGKIIAIALSVFVVILLVIKLKRF